MQIQRYSLCLAVVSLALAFNTARADHDKTIASQFTAKDLIGMKVMNDQDEKLGTIQDIVISLDSASAPCAIINPPGLGGSVAVPLHALKCSADGKSLMLSATKEELKAASKTPTGNWSEVENARWTKSVTGYYGTPRFANNRFERESADEENGIRVFTRSPAPKGAEKLMQPTDKVLCERVCESIDNIQVYVENGTVHLYGQVDSEATRSSLESKVGALTGVNKVESHLKVKGQ